MPTFIYAPGVKAYIESSKTNQVIDVSEDLVEGSLTRRSDGVSTFNFSIQNLRRKYDGLFTPNDRIVVMMKRVKWMRVFTGYLNAVPIFTVWPRVVPLAASCSLKRLQYFYWDSALSASQTLVRSHMQAPGVQSSPDGGIKNAALAVLENVVGWPTSKVHIAQIPIDWFRWAVDIAEEIKAGTPDALLSLANDMGAGASIGGSTVTLNNTGTGSLPDAPEGGTLPSQYGKCSIFATGTDPDNGFALTGEARNPRGSMVPLQDEYFCAMRWPYVRATGRRSSPITEFYLDGPGKAGPKTQAAIAFWRNKRILVINPRNGKAVVVRAADWGPNTWAGRDIDLSAKAAEALGVVTDDYVQIAFAKDQNAKPGPVRLDPGNDPTLQANLGQIGQNNPSVGTVGANTASAFLNVALKLVEDHPNIPYQLGNDSHYTTDVPTKLDCSSFTQWVYFHTVGQVANFMPRTSAQQAEWCRNKGVLSKDIATGLRTKGALLFRSTNGQPSGVGHVVISCGDGEHVVGSHHTGTFASVIRTRGNYTFYGLPPNINYQGAVAPGTLLPGSLGVPSSSGLSTANSVSSSESPPGTGDPIDQLFAGFTWIEAASSSTEAENLVGIRSLLNDEPILPYIKNLMNSSMRSFSSGPNGDFIAWFPDYYGLWGTAAKMVVRPIELQDFSVEWSDDYFVTHQFVTQANTTTVDFTSGNISSDQRDITTAGVVSIDMKAVLKALFNKEGTPDDTKKFTDFIYQKFGARPDYQQLQGIQSPKGAFFMALFLFMRQWAYQYNADVPMTFMPELWPGMLLQLPDFNFQAYVTTVTHTFRFGKGGGFSTSANIAAPAHLSAESDLLLGLPQAGQYKPGGAGLSDAFDRRHAVSDDNRNRGRGD